jgi:MarR family transcriptional regulator, organic hydroperoxide resistance regulator
MPNRRRALRESLTKEMRRFLADGILFNQQLAERLGINATDYQVLNLLGLYGPATPSDLARLSGLSSGGMTVVIDRLEKAHYIERERNPDDRRSVIIRFVATQEKRLVGYYKPILARMDKVLAAYGEKDLTLIVDFFARSNSTDADRPPAARQPIAHPSRATITPTLYRDCTGDCPL